MAAECLRRLFGGRGDEGDDENEQDFVRAYVGALLIADGLDDLRVIRKALATKKE